MKEASVAWEFGDRDGRWTRECRSMIAIMASCLSGIVSEEVSGDNEPNFRAPG
jgi:hypothetical protein